MLAGFCSSTLPFNETGRDRKTARGKPHRLRQTGHRRRWPSLHMFSKSPGTLCILGAVAHEAGQPAKIKIRVELVLARKAECSGGPPGQVRIGQEFGAIQETRRRRPYGVTSPPVVCLQRGQRQVSLPGSPYPPWPSKALRFSLSPFHCGRVQLRAFLAEIANEGSVFEAMLGCDLGGRAAAGLQADLARLKNRDPQTRSYAAEKGRLQSRNACADDRDFEVMIALQGTNETSRSRSTQMGSASSARPSLAPFQG